MEETVNIRKITKPGIRFRNFHKLRIVIYLTIWATLFALCNQRVTLSVAIIGFINIVDGNDGGANKITQITRASGSDVNGLKDVGNFSYIKKEVPEISRRGPLPVFVTTLEVCPNRYVNKVPGVEESTTRYQWTKDQQEVSILTYNLGYMIGHVPGMFLTVKIGIHKVMIICIFLCSFLTLSSVWVVSSYVLFVSVRVAVGFISGSMYPIINEAVAVHAPPRERPIVHMCIHTANLASSAMVFPLGGYFIEYYPDGWKYIYYVTAAIGFVVGLFWTIFAFSDPDENPWMSIDEQNKIRNELYQNGKPPKKTLSNVPYKSIFTDKHMYIDSCVHFAKLLILYMNLLGVVKYFREFFRLSPMMSGLYGVIPFMCECVLQISYSGLMRIVLRDRLSKTQTRRLHTFIGALGCGIFLFSASYINCDNLVGGIVLQSLSLMFMAPYQGGYFLAIIERYGRYSGIVFAFINIAGSLSGLVQRFVVLTLRQYFSMREAYQWSFAITALASFILSMPYIIFGTADQAEWVKVSPAVPKKENTLVVKESEENLLKSSSDT